MEFHFESLRLQHAATYRQRTGRKLTKTQLAHDLGTHSTTLRTLEDGTASAVSIELLDNACRFFGVGIDQIMTPTLPDGMYGQTKR